MAYCREMDYCHLMAKIQLDNICYSIEGTLGALEREKINHQSPEKKREREREGESAEKEEQ